MKKIYLTLIIVLTSLILFADEICLKKSWDEYNKRNWDLAIQNAEDCILNFKPQADRIQKELKDKNYHLPKNFTVANALTSQEKDEIFSHGLLNDVVAAYWICGMSYLHKNNKSEANNYFREAEKLTFGLCYNDKTFLFWSPSDDARLRVNN